MAHDYKTIRDTELVEVSRAVAIMRFGKVAFSLCLALVNVLYNFDGSVYRQLRPCRVPLPALYIP